MTATTLRTRCHCGATPTFTYCATQPPLDSGAVIVDTYAMCPQGHTWLIESETIEEREPHDPPGR